jgi:hypothetical protein
MIAHNPIGSTFLPRFPGSASDEPNQHQKPPFCAATFPSSGPTLTPGYLHAGLICNAAGKLLQVLPAGRVFFLGNLQTSSGYLYVINLERSFSDKMQITTLARTDSDMKNHAKG